MFEDDSSDEDEEILLSYYYLKSKKLKKERALRSSNVSSLNEPRLEKGEFHVLVKDMRIAAELTNNATYFDYFRMTPERFDLLLTYVGPKIRHIKRHRIPIEPAERLAVFLRVMASGNTLRSVAQSYRMGYSTVGLIVKEVAAAMYEALQPEYMPSPTTEMWIKTADDFEKHWQFPNCIGAIDGKHVQIIAPANSGSLYHCYKGGFSLVLMAIADANYTFVAIDVGAYGHQSDGGVWKRSGMGRALTEKKLQLPDGKPLPGQTIPLPFVFVADAAFPLNENILRPYGGNKLTHAQRIFNYRLSRGRGKIETVFGIFSGKFRLFRRPIEMQPETVALIVKAGAVLHNFLRKLDGTTPDSNRRYMHSTYVDRESEDGTVIPGEWRQSHGLATGKSTDHWGSLARVGSNNAGRRANGIRDPIAWQNRMIYGEDHPLEGAEHTPV